MGGRYGLDFKKSQELEQAMKQIPDKSEKLVNEILHTKGTKMMIQSIVGFMPVSDRDKKHANASNPLKADTFNLGFEVYTRGGDVNARNSFGYLVFPDEGRGRSNPIAQEFFKRGGDSASDAILSQVLGALEQAHKNII